MKKLFIFCGVFLLVMSCNSKKKFESDKWIPFEEGVYGQNYRYKMLDDLVNNVLKFDSRGKIRFIN
ncbi:MAG: hypothetical protein ACRC8Z_09635 [Empedobacter falsenii]